MNSVKESRELEGLGSTSQGLAGVGWFKNKEMTKEDFSFLFVFYAISFSPLFIDFLELRITIYK